MREAGFRIKDSGSRIEDSGLRIESTGNMDCSPLNPQS